MAKFGHGQPQIGYYWHFRLGTSRRAALSHQPYWSRAACNAFRTTSAGNDVAPRERLYWNGGCHGRGPAFRAGTFDGGTMTTASGWIHESQEEAPESLRTLIKYLELSLDKGKAVVLMRHEAGDFSVSLGNPADEENPLTRQGSVTGAVANEILAYTQPGANLITSGEQTYRFFRSFAQVGEAGAVVFAPA